jgi:hypothetical protein
MAAGSARVTLLTASPHERVCARSTSVTSMGGGRLGGLGDAFGIDDQRLCWRRTTGNVARPTGADVPGAVEHQFGLAAVIGPTK